MTARLENCNRRPVTMAMTVSVAESKAKQSRRWGVESKGVRSFVRNVATATRSLSGTLVEFWGSRACFDRVPFVPLDLTPDFD